MPEPPEAVVNNLAKRYPTVPREVIIDELKKVGNHFGIAVATLKIVAKQYKQWGGVATTPAGTEGTFM